jgi:Rrf2 family cysteine metabolism transcriptional repressor
MKLSTKGHYGMHAMMDLAARYGQGAVLLRDLCEIHGFSEKYLEQLLRSLRQAGMVESVRGARGGYWLTRPPDEITLLEVVESLEGELQQLPSKCRSDCVKSSNCAMLQAWYRATEAIREVLAGTTLGDLLKKQKELDRSESGADYSI